MRAKKYFDAFDQMEQMVREGKSHSGREPKCCFLNTHGPRFANISAVSGLNFPDDGLLLHTNHFRAPAFDRKDVSLWVMPDSPFRLERLAARVAGDHDAGRLSIDTFRAALADHANHPSGICCHPDVRMDIHDQGATVASVLMDLDARTMWVADGHPCTAPYRELDYREFLSKPSPVNGQKPSSAGVASR